MRRLRALLVLAVTLALGVAGSPAPASAAWDPGFIISDAVFYDARAMSEDQTRSFIDSRGARCVPAAGNTCLKDYVESTSTIPADAYCSTYHGAPSESAARIIAKAATACGINPQVLLVTLQKEQGLVTATTGKPPATFRRALGFGCPDNAGGWCDPAYAGFFVQVQRAARQFQVYRARPTSYSYVAGRWNTILYHPNQACGTAQVFVQNQATAGLYIYTPYVPNAAALAAGYGTGDACSSYGNRNFYNYFTDWFGSTGIPVSPWIWGWYQDPAHRTAAGEPTTAPTTVAGGVRQQFAGGTVYVSGAAGIHLVPAGLIALYYDALGGPAGVLGFPSGSHSAPGGGLAQPFQNGTVYISGASGFAYVSGWMLDHYRSSGGATGPLGFPTSPQATVAGGLTQSFQGGTVWISGVGGVRTLPASVQSAFAASGGPAGPLGFPVADVTTSGGITEQRFQHGVMYSDGATTSYATGLPLAVLEASGGAAGPLGIPVAPQRVVGGGIVQPFRSSTLYISGIGGIQTIAAGGLVDSYYGALGGPTGVLGWPNGPTSGVAGGIEHPFVNGRMYISGATGFTYATSWMDEIYRGRGGPAGPLGFPTDSTHVEAGGLAQSFQGASIYISGVGGVRSVPDRVRTAYLERGGPGGPLGFPVDDVGRTNTMTFQRFQGGTLVLRDDGTIEVLPG